MIYLFLFLFLCLFPGFSPAAEREQEEPMAPVVVTATRTEQAREETTTSITVVTEAEIQARQANTVLEVLREVPGVDVVQAGSRGNITSVFIRGSNSNQVLVLVDGMEVNSVTSGGFDFAHLTTDNVERIEILRGAGGALYGSKAVGGVIHIITKKVRGPLAVNLSAEGGNARTHRQFIGLNGSREGLSYSLTASHLRTDGFRSVNDDYRNNAVSTRLDYELIRNGSLSAIFNLTDSSLGLVNNDVSFGLRDPNARAKDQHLLGQLSWRHEPLPQWDYRLSVGVKQSHERFSDPDPISFCPFFAFASQTLIKPRIVSPQFQTNYRFEAGHHATFGVDLDVRRAGFTNTDGCGEVTSFNKSQSNQAVYLQDQLKLFNERLMLVAGVRYDRNQHFGSQWSPSFSAAYLFDATGTRIKTSYAEGFRAPTFNDLFFPIFSNPDLRPEVSWEVNGGIEQRLWKDRLQLEAIYFHREAKELIVFRGLRPENIGQVIFDGVELIARARVGYGVSVGGNYTYVNSSQRLVRRPKHKGNVTLNYEDGPFNVNLYSHIFGRRLDFDAVTFDTIDKGGFTRFDLASSYGLPWRPAGVGSWSLFGRIENLFNKRYEQADGFRSPPFNFIVGLRGVLGSH